MIAGCPPASVYDVRTVCRRSQISPRFKRCIGVGGTFSERRTATYMHVCTDAIVDAPTDGIRGWSFPIRRNVVGVRTVVLKWQASFHVHVTLAVLTCAAQVRCSMHPKNPIYPSVYFTRSTMGAIDQGPPARYTSTSGHL